jgi:microcystin-dependent protein
MAEPFIGEIRPFAFGIVPRGWALCNGQILSINTNQALYSLLGTRYGGNGTTTFALPNLQGRTPIHFSPSQAIALGQSAGEASHTLTVSEIPAHMHQAFASQEDATLQGAEGNTWGKLPANRAIYATTTNTTMNAQAIGVAGGSQPHNNMQPYTALSFCIALQGLWPSRS